MFVEKSVEISRLSINTNIQKSKLIIEGGYFCIFKLIHYKYFYKLSFSTEAIN